MRDYNGGDSPCMFVPVSLCDATSTHACMRARATRRICMNHEAWGSRGVPAFALSRGLCVPVSTGGNFLNPIAALKLIPVGWILQHRSLEHLWRLGPACNLSSWRAYVDACRKTGPTQPPLTNRLRAPRVVHMGLWPARRGEQQEETGRHSMRYAALCLALLRIIITEREHASPACEEEAALNPAGPRPNRAGGRPCKANRVLLPPPATRGKQRAPAPPERTCQPCKAQRRKSHLP